MDTTDSGLVTITGAEYARLREIDQGPYTFIWKVRGRILCEPMRTIEEAREAAERAIMYDCASFQGRIYADVVDEILASVGFVVRPDVEHCNDPLSSVEHEMWGDYTATPVKATINDEGVVTIVGP